MKHPMIEASERKRQVQKLLSEGKTTDEIEQILPGVKFVTPVTLQKK